MLQPLNKDISNRRDLGLAIRQRPAVLFMQEHRRRLHLDRIRCKIGFTAAIRVRKAS